MKRFLQGETYLEYKNDCLLLCMPGNTIVLTLNDVQELIRFLMDVNVLTCVTAVVETKTEENKHDDLR
jgi:hypothetical protein